MAALAPATGLGDAVPVPESSVSKDERKRSMFFDVIILWLSASRLDKSVSRGAR